MNNSDSNKASDVDSTCTVGCSQTAIEIRISAVHLELDIIATQFEVANKIESNPTQHQPPDS
jgi:hypothetical protein